MTSALERLIDDPTAEKIAAALIRLATSIEKQSVAAAREIMDRIEGKVVIPVDAKVDLGDMTDEQLATRIMELNRELGYVIGDTNGQ